MAFSGNCEFETNCSLKKPDQWVIGKKFATNDSVYILCGYYCKAYEDFHSGIAIKPENNPY